MLVRTSWRPAASGAAGLIAVVVLSGLGPAIPLGDDPWADEVISYDEGSNPAAGFTTPGTALGPPERFTGEGVFPGAVTVFNSPFGTDEIVSVGEGGALVVRFDTPIADDPDNPYGIDLLVFGNALFVYDGAGVGNPAGLFSDPGLIDISADGITWVAVPGVAADDLFPTEGYLDLADPFKLVWLRFRALAGPKHIRKDRANGVDADHLDPGILLLEKPGRTADGAAGPHPDDDVGNPPFGLIPDFGTRRLVVCLAVRRIVVLVRVETVRDLAIQAARNRMIAARIVGLDFGGSDDHFRTEGTKSIYLFLAHLVGHGEDTSIALDGRGQREAHAGVTRRPLDQGGSWLKPTVLLGILHHLDADPVLDASSGIQVLQLGENRRLESVADLAQTDQRRVPNSIENVVVPHLSGWFRRMPRTSSHPYRFEAPEALRAFFGDRAPLGATVTSTR